jgi:anti-sigma regulatory factor (Ser/Thr protein kinase)
MRVGMSGHDDGDRWELGRTIAAAGEARAHVLRYRDTLGEDGWQRARLLVSELATNAVRHGVGRIELRVTRTPTGLRFTVGDEGGRHPTPRTPGDDGGFGLHLVDDLSDRWGHGTEGTSVWFDVDIRRAA